MHEFSLAQNIIEIVEEAIQKNNVTIVTKVELEIGKLSGIEISALETAIECLRPESVLINAEVVMKTVESVAVCRKCQQHYTPEDLFSSCPRCNSYGPEIISGKEMIVKSIVAE